MRHDQVMSVHDLGAGELLGALHVMDAWPRRVRVVGLEPQAIDLVEAEIAAAQAARAPDESVEDVVVHEAVDQVEPEAEEQADEAETEAPAAELVVPEPEAPADEAEPEEPAEP